MSSCITNFLQILTFGIIPFLLNASQIIFIIFSYDSTQKMSSATNVLFIITIILYYFEGSVTVYIYNLATNGWFLRLNNDLSAKLLICLFHPIYYLITLPMSMKAIIHSIGTPKNLWNHCASEDWVISKDTTSSVDGRGMNCISLKCFLISVPFSLFFILYSIFIVVLAPLVWFFLSAIGFGPLGVSMHLCLQDELGFSDSLFYSIELGGSLSISFFALVNATVAFVICTVYVCTVGTPWFLILFYCCAALMYIAACPSFIDICTHGSPALAGEVRNRKQTPQLSNGRSNSTVSSNANVDSSQNESQITHQSSELSS